MKYYFCLTKGTGWSVFGFMRNWLKYFLQVRIKSIIFVSHKELDEVFLVPLPHTVVDPRAVVVHPSGNKRLQCFRRDNAICQWFLWFLWLCWVCLGEMDIIKQSNVWRNWQCWQIWNYDNNNNIKTDLMQCWQIRQWCALGGRYISHLGFHCFIIWYLILQHNISAVTESQ